jgi:hypothetical protein
MHYLKSHLIAVVILSLIAGPAVSAAGASTDYSKRILGCWLGSRKFEVYHADGTWGVKRNEDAPEDRQRRHWHINGNRLTITYLGDHGLQTAVYTIVSCTDHKMVLSIGSYTEEYTRYSADCQTKA